MKREAVAVGIPLLLVKLLLRKMGLAKMKSRARTDHLDESVAANALTTRPLESQNPKKVSVKRA